MNRQLRKRHLQIWLTLGLLLPSGILTAWLVVPKPLSDHLLQPAVKSGLPVILKTIERNDYTINLRSNAGKSSFQLEWINRSALTVPSEVIYKTDSTGGMAEDSEIIGRIAERGIYYFPLKMDSANIHIHFILYDIIHHQSIGRINF